MRLHRLKQRPRTAQPSQRLASRYYRATTGSGSASPPRSKKTAKASWLGRLADLTVIIAVVGLLAYSLIVTPQPTVKADRTDYHTLDSYRQAVVSEIQAIKYRNKLTFDEQSLGQALQAKYPEISTVEVRLPLFSQKPLVTLTVAPPNFKLAADHQLYIIDSQGSVAGLASQLSLKNEKLPLVTDLSGFEIALGQPVLTSSGVNFINQLLGQLKAKRISIAVLSLPAKGKDLHFQAKGEPYFVKFYLDGEPQLQIGQYLASRQHFKRSGQAPRQYLDVRVPGKVFYK
ncbi:hypothetical protein HY380_01190 [Candidatus Saccharibacteria bacterium]|nr:hypothetical protein [Candidatus Saccharibacteria bacterium]